MSEAVAIKKLPGPSAGSAGLEGSIKQSIHRAIHEDSQKIEQSGTMAKVNSIFLEQL